MYLSIMRSVFVERGLLVTLVRLYTVKEVAYLVDQSFFYAQPLWISLHAYLNLPCPQCLPPARSLWKSFSLCSVGAAADHASDSPRPSSPHPRTPS